MWAGEHCSPTISPWATKKASKSLHKHGSVNVSVQLLAGTLEPRETSIDAPTSLIHSPRSEKETLSALTAPREFTRMFPSFTSRWMTLLRCKVFKPSHSTCASYWRACLFSQPPISASESRPNVEMPELHFDKASELRRLLCCLLSLGPAPKGSLALFRRAA